METFHTVILMLESTLRVATPLILAALAGLFAERSGVFDIGLEGKMLTGAFAAGTVAALTHSAWIGLGAAILVSVALALVHGYASITHRGNQIVSGVAINMIASGITVTLGNAWFKRGGQTPTVENGPPYEGILLPWVPPTTGQIGAALQNAGLELSERDLDTVITTLRQQPPDALAGVTDFRSLVDLVLAHAEPGARTAARLKAMAAHADAGGGHVQGALDLLHHAGGHAISVVSSVMTQLQDLANGLVTTVQAERFTPVTLPYARELADVPIVGGLYSELLSGHNILVYLALLMVPLTAWVVFRTRFGLRLRAVGENPAAVDTAGISVYALRYRALIIGGVLCGLAGAYLSIAQGAAFGRDMTAGQGYIALAALIFAKWRPWPVLFTCLLFGFFGSLEARLQGVTVPGIGQVPVQAIQALPYVLTVVLLAGFIGKAIPPKAGGIPYVKER